MTKYRSHSAAFKRQVAEEFLAGETLHALSKRHDISRQLVRIWFGKFEARALDDNVQAANLIPLQCGLTIPSPLNGGRHQIRLVPLHSDYDSLAVSG